MKRVTKRLSKPALAAAVACLALTVGIGAQQAPDRSRPPASGPAPVLKVPPVQKRALSNGLPVWIVEMHEVPVVDLTLIVKSGSAADPASLAAAVDRAIAERTS